MDLRVWMSPGATDPAPAAGRDVPNLGDTGGSAGPEGGRPSGDPAGRDGSHSGQNGLDQNGLDREFADLLQGLRWRTWMVRIEAVLFASAAPVGRVDLARVVGQGALVDLLLDDLAADLEGRAVAIAGAGAGWILRTRPAHAAAIRTAADVAGQGPDLRRSEIEVLATIAWRQPVTRADLAEIFGRAISRDLLARLEARGLVANGPRSPARGAPRAWVTTDTFLATFDLETLQDLPEPGEGE